MSWTPNFPIKILVTLIFLVIINTKQSATGIINPTTETPELEPIGGTRNFKLYGKKGKDDKRFDGRVDVRYVHCIRPAKCEKLQFDNCFGTKIPYTYTSLDLTDSLNQRQVKDALHAYQALRHVPKCWAVIQTFICAVFVPKCEVISNKEMVYLPSLEMCKITLDPCRMLYNMSYFPEFLKCNETLFPSKCNNDVREMKFNVSGKCLEPLVPAESSSSYYDGIEGCGIQCKDPLYTDDEHRQIHKLIGWCASLCFFSNFFVIATFLVDWKNANKYPAVIVFYINLCFLLLCLGWLAQFSSGSREDIVCRKDGTLRHSEPSAGENLSCIVVFVLVYYFLMAAMVWFVILTYALQLQAIGNVQDRIDKKGSYFHLVSWSLPLVLTIAIMALSEIDGNSTVGICFVGYVNHPMRAGFLLGPIIGVIIIGGYFTVRGMVRLFGLKNDIKSTSASNKFHQIIVRMGLIALFSFIFILVTITCHISEFRNSGLWEVSLREFVFCRISSTYNDDQKICKIKNRPSVAILQLHLLCLFGAGIAMSSWCWWPSSVETWKRYVKKKCGREINDEVKMQKHKVIAQTWAKRKEFEDKGRLSITLYNSHTDPVDLNFLNFDVNDLNSTATNEISSTWANYLPQFVKRRFALTGAATNSSSHGGGPRKSSLDSEISFSVRHVSVSVDSRRNSVDSQVSVKIAEMKTKVASRSRSSASSIHHNTGKTTKARNRRRDFFATARKCTRKESSTSVESQIVAMKKTSYSGKNGLFSHHTKQTAKNMKRRSATTAGQVDPNDINDFLSNNDRLLFLLQSRGMNTTSDDEEVSATSFKIQDSRLDVVLRQQEELSSDNHGEEPRIEECNGTDDDETSNQQKNLDDILRSLQQQKPSFDTASRHSKNSSKSRYSRRSLRKNGGRHSKRSGISRSIVKKDVTEINLADFNGSSLTSYSSELELPLTVRSSFSGLSVEKTQSRTSKRSCDVGIQANAHEIATQTMSSIEAESDDANCVGSIPLNVIQNKAKNALKSSNGDESEEMETEYHHLIPSKRRDGIIAMTESERLKMLLLPSK